MRSWDLTIKEQRRMAKILDDAYYIAKLKGERETSLPEATFSDKCSYEQITNDEFYPYH